MRGDKGVVAARLAGQAPAVLTFFMAPGTPDRLGHIHVTEADCRNRNLDLRFVIGLPVALNGFLGDFFALRDLYDHLTKFEPASAVLAGPGWLLQWEPETGEIEWEA